MGEVYEAADQCFAPRHLPTRPAAPVAAPADRAHETYRQAQDALDRYYLPHAVDNAIRLFQATVNQDPRFALAYAGLARANFYLYWQMRDARYIAPARDNAEQALLLDATLASVHVTLGRLYTGTGENDLAAQELNQALRLSPRDAEAYYALAALYNAQGRTADVVPTYQKAMDLAPQDPNVLLRAAAGYEVLHRRGCARIHDI